MGLTFKNVDYSEYADYVPKTTPRTLEGDLFRVVYNDHKDKIQSKEKRRSKIRNSMKKFNKNLKNNTKTETLKEKINLSQNTLIDKNIKNDNSILNKDKNKVCNLDNVPKDAVFGPVMNSIMNLKDLLTNKDKIVQNNPAFTGYVPKNKNDLLYSKFINSNENYNGHIPKATLQHSDMNYFNSFQPGPSENGSSYAPYPNIYDKKNSLKKKKS